MSKALLRCFVVALLLAGASEPTARAQSDPQSEYKANLANAKGRLGSATALAQKVREISESGTISSEKKRKRISTVVRVAVVAATAYKDDPDVVLGIAIKMAEAAARAAPRFAEEISNAVAFTPAVSRIDGAQSRVRTAAFAAARGPRNRRARPTEYAVSTPPAEEAASSEGEARPQAAPAEAPARSRAQATENAPVPESGATAANVPPETAPDETPADAMASDEGESPAPKSRSASSKISKGESSKLTATASLSAQRDDNVYFSHADKVADTIYSIAPGLGFVFGQKSLESGSLSAQENFLRYADHSSPNVNLASGSGNFGYNDGEMNLTANASYQQLFQNNIDVLSLGAQALYRSNIYNLAANGEFQLGANTSAAAGVTYTHLAYALPTLLSYEDIGFPVDVFYKLTPKVDISAGYTYGTFRPQGSGPDAKDGYANIGARGDFTPMLTGTVSVGYLTRSFDTGNLGPSATQYQSSHGLGFTGNLSYDITPKTSANLTFSRSYSASALAQTTTNSAYTLSVTTDLGPQWKIGESLSEQIIDYGPQVFFFNNTLSTGSRRDALATANVYLTYIYSRWLSGSVAYTLRNDRSTFSAINFSDDVFGLNLNLSY